MASQPKGVSILESDGNLQLKLDELKDTFCHSKVEEMPVSLCTIIGPYRSGKSSFFNLLAQLLKEQKVRTCGL